MVEFNYTENTEIEKTILNMAEYFPLCIEYLEKASSLYLSEKAEWYTITFPNITLVPACLMCFMENRFEEDTLHLSIFEVATECRGNGRGTQIMKQLIRMVSDKYSGITLQVREPNLIGFYQSLGFVKHHYVDNIEYYKLTL